MKVYFFVNHGAHVAFNNSLGFSRVTRHFLAIFENGFSFFSAIISKPVAYGARIDSKDWS